MNNNEGFETYVLRKDWLLGFNGVMWAMQDVDVDNLIGKTINIYGYIVKNHPLDNMRDNNKHQTKLWVICCEGKNSIN